MWGRKARRRIDALEKQLAFLAGRNDDQAEAIANLDKRNALLREANGRLRTDMAAMRERLPRVATEGICGSKAAVTGSVATAPDATEVCVLPYGHGSDWHEAEGGMRWTYRLAPSASELPVPAAMVTTDDFSANLLAALNPADPDPARPYIPTYEAGKDEQR